MVTTTNTSGVITHLRFDFSWQCGSFKIHTHTTHNTRLRYISTIKILGGIRGTPDSGWRSMNCGSTFIRIPESIITHKSNRFSCATINAITVANRTREHTRVVAYTSRHTSTVRKTIVKYSNENITSILRGCHEVSFTSATRSHMKY